MSLCTCCVTKLCVVTESESWPFYRSASLEDYRRNLQDVVLILKVFLKFSTFHIDSRRKFQWIICSQWGLFIKIFKSLKSHEREDILNKELARTVFLSDCKLFKFQVCHQSNIIILSFSLESYSSAFTLPRRDNIKNFGYGWSIGIVSAFFLRFWDQRRNSWVSLGWSHINF